MKKEEHNHLLQVLYEDGNSETIDWTERIGTSYVADICVSCAICKEATSMNSHDCRAYGVFICDKCKKAILHIRKILEDGGSVT